MSADKCRVVVELVLSKILGPILMCGFQRSRGVDAGTSVGVDVGVDVDGAYVRQSGLAYLLLLLLLILLLLLLLRPRGFCSIPELIARWDAMHIGYLDIRALR
jgi:hypothetical protein